LGGARILFHRFGQAKFLDGGKILGSSQFSVLPHLPPKTMLILKGGKVKALGAHHSNFIISVLSSQFYNHSFIIVVLYNIAVTFVHYHLKLTYYLCQKLSQQNQLDFLFTILITTKKQNV
jgi:hypothetical protein